MKLSQYLLAALLCTALSGCLSYSNQQLPQVEQWPLTAGQAQPSVHVSLNAQYLHNDSPLKGRFNLPHLEKLILEEYRSSQRFTQVNSAAQTNSRQVDVQVTNHERSNMVAAFICGFSMMLIPSKANNELSMETIFRDEAGNELGRIIKRERITTWFQIGLIFALPFNQSADPILRNLTRSTLEEASRNGFI